MQGSLDSYTLITGDEYMLLVSPEFEGQTRVNAEGYYYMCWSTADGKFKTKNKL